MAASRSYLFVNMREKSGIYQTIGRAIWPDDAYEVMFRIGLHESFLVSDIGCASAHPDRRIEIPSSTNSSVKCISKMAPHPGIDTDEIREKARKDLLGLLEGVCKAAQ